MIDRSISPSTLFRASSPALELPAEALADARSLTAAPLVTPPALPPRLAVCAQAEAEEKDCTVLEALIDIARDAGRGVYAVQAVGTVSASQGEVGLEPPDAVATTPVQSV